MPKQNEVDSEQAYGDSTGLTAKDAGVEPAIHGGEPEDVTSGSGTQEYVKE